VRFVALEVGVLAASTALTVAALMPLQPMLISLLPDSLAGLAVASESGKVVLAASYLALTQLLERKGKAWMRLPAADAGAVATLRPGGRASPKRVLLVVAGCFSAAALILAGMFLRDTSTVEDLNVRQIAQDDRWLMTASIALAAPIDEEIIFRALLFARCARVLGVPLAVLSQAALFGAVHHSETSDKVLASGLMGAVFALSYALSGSLLAPVALHVANNSMAVLESRPKSPMQDASTMEDTMRRNMLRNEKLGDVAWAAKRFLLHWQTKLGLRRVPEAPASDDVYAWLQADLQTPRPAVAQLIHALFAALDREGKGALSVDELAWVQLLHPETRAQTIAALEVLKQRVRVSEEEAQTSKAVSTVAPTVHVPLVTVPPVAPQLSPSFFTAEQRAANRARLTSVTAAHPALQALLPEAADRLSAGSSSDNKIDRLRARYGGRPPSLPDRALQVQRFNGYLAALNRAQHGSFAGGDAVTREAFETSLCHLLLLRPSEGGAWMAAMQEALMDDSGKHPTQRLLQQHAALR